MTYSTEDLIAALADLGLRRRHHVQVLAARFRDNYVVAGDHKMAAACNATAVLIAEIEDDERETLTALDADVEGSP